MSATDNFETSSARTNMPLFPDDPVHSLNCSQTSASSTSTRPSSSGNSDSNHIQRHPQLWFDDGNIVLVAQRTAFCIYRDLIARQSTIFSDMFASSTSSADDNFDGCLVVHLSDSPSDLAHLLHVLLPMSRIHTRTAGPDSVCRAFDELSAVIRLAHKYDIPQAEDAALLSLREYSFDPLFEVPSPSCPSPLKQLFAPLESAHHIAIVNLARLTNRPSFLPLALYHCTYLGSALFDGWMREDGTTEYLSDADLRLCVDARAVLMQERACYISTVFAPPSSGCERPESCTEMMRGATSYLLSSAGLLRADAMRDLSYFVDLLGRKTTQLCGPCMDELLARNEAGRKDIFDRIPEIFGIAVEGWPRWDGGPGAVAWGAADAEESRALR